MSGVNNAVLADVDGRKKVVYNKHGEQFVRDGFSLPVEVARKFTRKCKMLHEPKSRVLQRLIEAFNRSSGWGTDTKTGFFFETRTSEHIKDAVSLVVDDLTG